MTRYKYYDQTFAAGTYTLNLPYTSIVHIYKTTNPIKMKMGDETCDDITIPVKTEDFARPIIIPASTNIVILTVDVETVVKMLVVGT